MKMTRNEALRILKDFQLWRRGVINEIKEDNYTVGQAIDKAIKELENIVEANKQPKRKMKRKKYANTNTKNN